MKSAVFVLALVALLAGTNAQDCTWAINSLPDPQALYIKVGGSLDLRGFWLPQSGDVVTVPNGEGVIFACPGGTLNGVGTTDATLTCAGGSSWRASNGNTYSFNSLTCSRDPFHDSIKTTLSCNNTGGVYTLMQIGFTLSNGDFYKLMDTCFDEATGDSIYSVHTQTPEIGGYQSGYPRPGFVQGPWYASELGSVDALYSFDSQLAAVTQAVGSASLAGSYIVSGTDYFFSRGHMTAKADFVYGAHQRATFWFLNVAPQFQTVNGANWNNLEMSVRAFADGRSTDLLVYTGTYGVTTFADVNGNQVPIYLYTDANGVGSLKAPFFYWRVVFEPSTGLATAFVGLNNPWYDNPGTEFYLCPDVSAQLPWLNWNPNNQYDGYSYACEVTCLAQYVREIPDLPVTGLLIN